jgi:hypothetical protein
VKSVHFLAVVVAAIGLVEAAADQPTNRSITKEPRYVHAPRYFMLVFGKQADLRWWCVLDGTKTLYVDRNQNGDLTEAGEQFSLKNDEQSFDIGDVAERDKTTHRNLLISKPIKMEERKHELVMVSIEIKGEYFLSTNIDLDETTARPLSAPARHFHGPLSIRPLDAETAFVRGDKQHQINLSIGTFDPGLTGKSGGDGVVLSHSKGVPNDIHPRVEIVFPPATPGGEPTVGRAELTDRC